MHVLHGMTRALALVGAFVIVAMPTLIQAAPANTNTNSNRVDARITHKADVGTVGTVALNAKQTGAYTIRMYATDSVEGTTQVGADSYFIAGKNVPKNCSVHGRQAICNLVAGKQTVLSYLGRITTSVPYYSEFDNAEHIVMKVTQGAQTVGEVRTDVGFAGQANFSVDSKSYAVGVANTKKSVNFAIRGAFTTQKGNSNPVYGLGYDAYIVEGTSSFTASPSTDVVPKAANRVMKGYVGRANEMIDATKNASQSTRKFSLNLKSNVPSKPGDINTTVLEFTPYIDGRFPAFQLTEQKTCHVYVTTYRLTGNAASDKKLRAKAAKIASKSNC